MTSGQTIQEKLYRRSKNRDLLIKYDEILGMNGRKVAEVTGYSEKYISNILNEKVDVEEKVWRFLEALFALECLNNARRNKMQEAKYFALADEYSPPTGKQFYVPPVNSSGDPATIPAAFPATPAGTPVSYSINKRRHKAGVKRPQST